MSSSGLLTSFLGALQASLAVLLTISYGAIAAQWNLLSEYAAKDISKTCVKMFLPALLIHNVGSQLDISSVGRYAPVLVYSIAYNVISMGLGIVVVKVFKLPSWVTPAIAFNNTTSLPLLLIQSLETAGILTSLTGGGSTSDAVDRAKSYFLINAMVSNSLTFALGPRLLNGMNEDAPDGDDDKKDGEQDGEDGGGENGNGQADEEDPDEQTSLLPDRIVQPGRRMGKKAYNQGKAYWDKMPSWAQNTLDFVYQFANAPLIGAIIGAIIGLTPPFHRWFFNESNEGGVFNAWLTSSIKNVGDLFASLQVIVVGVKLSQAMRKMKQGEASGELPWKPFIFITFVRNIVWPLISIPLIWAMATKTNILSNDPILWFAMMLMPTGPPAMKLTALADVNGSGEEEKMSIAKFLTASYLVSPLICFSVVGSLKASEAAMGK